jgi:hypothetical protein
VYWSDYALDVTMNTPFQDGDHILWCALDHAESPRDTELGYQGKPTRLCCPDPACGFELTANLSTNDYWELLSVVDAQHERHAQWIEAFNTGNFTGRWAGDFV